MSYEGPGKSWRQDEQADELAATAQRPVAPGKRPRTASLPRRTGHAPAAIQLQRGSTVAPELEGDAALTEQWMNAAMRPDLYPLPVQRKAGGGAVSQALPPASGGGQPMPQAVRAKMEHALGADFSAVRIHEGSHADALGALAYTQGTDIHFAPGQYRPHDAGGQELLGHELQHVVQQAQGRARPTAQAKGVDINDDPALEREADEAGARAARGEAVHATAGQLAGRPALAPSGGTVQRQRRQAIHGAGDFLVSNDNTMAIAANGPTKTLYAKTSKINNIAIPDAPLRFSALGETLTVPEVGDAPEKTLNRVHVRNLQNNTEGDNMEIVDDCSRAAETVIGYNPAHETLNASIELGGWNKQYETTLSQIVKLEVLIDVWEKHGLLEQKFALSFRGLIDKMKLQLGEKNRNGAEALAKRVDELLTKHYSKIKGASPDKVEQAEKAAGINRFADVLPGQAFVIVSSNDKHPEAEPRGLGTWVYHWAGVILAGEGGDTVTLEILANAGPKNWYYDMYSAGTDQSFHDKHTATLQHGTTPFTLGMKRSDEKTVTTAGEVGAIGSVAVAIGRIVQVIVTIAGSQEQRTGVRLGDGNVLLLTGNWAPLGATIGVHGAARGELDSLLIDAAGNDWGAIDEKVDLGENVNDLEAELALLTENSSSQDTGTSDEEIPPDRPVMTLALLPDWSKFEPST